MARGRGRGEDYPIHVVTKRGIVELVAYIALSSDAGRRACDE